MYIYDWQLVNMLLFFYCSMLQKDKEEAEALKLARILEEEKAQFAVCIKV